VLGWTIAIGRMEQCGDEGLIVSASIVDHLE
jgi:hypothetical protein